jgi:uncharacterized protein
MRQVFKKLHNLPQALRFVFLQLAAVLVAAQLFVAPAAATGIYEIPDLSAIDRAWVLDQADVLSRSSEGRISSALEALAKQTGNEVRFVTIHRLDYGETAETLAQQLFKKWFPTSEEQENQALLLLDNVTNGAALVSGSKVQAVLPEAIAQSIAQETLLVPIRAGNYNQGFVDGSDRLVAVLSGQPDPGPPQVDKVVSTEGTFKPAQEAKQERGNSTVLVVGLLLAATIIPMATYYLYLYLQAQ